MSATRRLRDTYIRAREVDEDDRDVVIGHRSTCSPSVAGASGVCGCDRALLRSRYMQRPPRVVTCW